MEISILQSKIHEVRGQKVMLDFDLALLYKVETRVLNQTVKRNISRFPEDFMFQLTLEEMENMSSQFVTTYPSKRPKTAFPFAFTEQGIAMLSGILNSEVAININIAIMRTFVIMRRFALEHKEFNSKLLEIESKYDKQFSDIYEALNFLIKRDENESIQKGRKQIGYKKQ
jgi:hypothetical protein